MLKGDPNYRFLKVGGRGLLSAATYWLWPDHLLVVEVVGYVERYRRFGYGDIQAVIIRRTQSAQVMRSIAVGLAVLLALFLFWFLASRAAGSWDTSDSVVTAVLGGALGVVLLSFMVNVLRGPSCVCHLVTAVKTHELPRLVRWRHAQRAVEALQPLVESAQNRVEPLTLAPAPETLVP